MKPYSPERKLLSFVAVSEYNITKGIIVGMFDGENVPSVYGKGVSGEGEIYQVKVVKSKDYKVGETILVWPEFVTTLRSKKA
jgi:hypothetical protein